jgi:thioredoxin-related protein
MTIRALTFVRMLALGLIGALSSWSPALADGKIEPIMTDDGLYTQDWFLQSFLDLNEDLDDAKASGKRFAIMWELKGCPYCEDTHVINFGDPKINRYVRENFVILQLNYLGSRTVTDFDGEELEERELREKYGIRFTPTFQFFPESSDAVGGASGQAVETARMPGYFKPDHFIAMFRFIAEKAYEGQTFQDYLAAGSS